MDNLPDLIKSISKPDLFEAFKVQLKKDFDNCGLSSDFITELIPDFEFILNILCVEINPIGKASNDKLMELLYRIDISELQIKKQSLIRPEASFDQIVAELIIKRELQKVVIKQMFKNKL